MESKELKENNIDNKYGIEYRKVGDYYIPNLVLEKEEKITLNKYGRLRLKFLKENNFENIVLKKFYRFFLYHLNFFLLYPCFL